MFDYELPEERIAQRPERERANARMLVGRTDGRPEDSCVSAFPGFIEPGDVVVVNDSRVLPCRFFAKKRGTGAEVEILLIERLPGDDELWEALARPMKRLRPGSELELSPSLTAEVIDRVGEDGERILLRLGAKDQRSVLLAIENEGSMPIPGYIRGGRSDETDRDRYQTTFAGTAGSVAAPTAGLHFTPELLAQVKAKGGEIATVTLHVGVASFAPVRDITAHRMPREWYRIPEATARAIARAKEKGKRVFAVGTTSTRSLESAAKAGGLGMAAELRPTELFITPGFPFEVVDALLTNFHQPKTTHLLLVSAFFGEEGIRELYEHALNSAYRFLSYGDCMLLLPSGRPN